MLVTKWAARSYDIIRCYWTSKKFVELDVRGTSVAVIFSLNSVVLPRHLLISAILLVLRAFIFFLRPYIPIELETKCKNESITSPHEKLMKRYGKIPRLHSLSTFLAERPHCTWVIHLLVPARKVRSVQVDSSRSGDSQTLQLRPCDTPGDYPHLTLARTPPPPGAHWDPVSIPSCKRNRADQEKSRIVERNESIKCTPRTEAGFLFQNLRASLKPEIFP